jgi:hypothetical protein
MAALAMDIPARVFLDGVIAGQGDGPSGTNRARTIDANRRASVQGDQRSRRKTW